MEIIQTQNTTSVFVKTVLLMKLFLFQLCAVFLCGIWIRVYPVSEYSSVEIIKYSHRGSASVILTRIPRVDLVVFITEDYYKENDNRKLILFRGLSRVYKRHFSYRCIVFTNNDNITVLFQDTCRIITDVKRNPFGLPYIYSMYSIASALFDAKYYGYVNSDILLEPVIFSALNYLDEQVSVNALSPYQELTGRVRPIGVDSLPSGFSSLNDITKCFSDAKKGNYPNRIVGSAVTLYVHDHA